MDESLDTDLLRALEEDVGAVYVGVREPVRVSEAEVHMRLCGEVEYRVDVMPLQAVDDLGRVGDVSVVEAKVPLVVQGAGVVERGAVVQLVEGDDVVSVRVGKCEVPDEPTRAVPLVLTDLAIELERKRGLRLVAYMKPAPPVTMMFFVSGSGSNAVLPVSTGASFQTPKSSKKLPARPLAPASGRRIMSVYCSAG